MTRHDGSELPSHGVQVPFPGAGIVTLHPVERWHVEHGNRWMGTNKSKLFEIAWDKAYIAKVQLHYVGAKKYTPTFEDFEEREDWTWISDLESEPPEGDTSSDSEVISPLSESSSEGEVEVAGRTEAERKKAERQAAKAKKEARAAAKTRAAREAAAERGVRRAETADRRAAGSLYLSSRGTHWGMDPNGGEPEALTLVKNAAALRKAKQEKAARKTARTFAASKAKAAEKAAKKGAARGESGMSRHPPIFLSMNEKTDCVQRSRQ